MKILKHISLSKIPTLCLLLLFAVCSLLQAQTEAPLQLEANISSSSCAGFGHSISLKVSGGQAPYTYRWQDGATGNFRKDLASGTYSCTVRDANGAQASREFNFAPQPPALELSYQQEDQGDGTYRINTEVKGGKAPYEYFWIGKGINMEASRGKSSLDELAKGSIQLLVRDANECAATIKVDIQ